MRLEINDNVLNNTTRCRKNFACLSGTGQCLCKLLSVLVERATLLSRKATIM